MILTKAAVGPYRSINTSQSVAIDPYVTVLVGMNEAGKTVFLKALHKSDDALGVESFNPTDDYPRRNLTAYLRKHENEPEKVVELTFQPTKAELESINKSLHTQLGENFTFTVTHNHGNSRSISISADEGPVMEALAKTPGLSSDAIKALSSSASIRAAYTSLSEMSLTDVDTEFAEGLKKRIEASPWKGSPVTHYEVWRKLSSMVPKFLYFSDYDLLPGKINLADLRTRLSTVKSDPTKKALIEPKHLSILALLRIAGVDLDDFDGKTTYEEMRAKVEGVSINLTDKVLEFWKQNEDLEVEVDIRPDSNDVTPFDNGPNLYLRIKNRRHRGVTTPFDQRSRGFIWFFSFLVWFDSVQAQLASSGVSAASGLILLLDEPGLALHALAQEDFLNYIDNLSQEHQVIYTTHSPFMVRSDRLNQVRIVEDKPDVGTTVSENLSGSDPRTIFPLQAALGWNVAQNLFISKTNLLVEGVSELAYLQTMSAILEASGDTSLDRRTTIVPVGGLNNVATFTSLLGANGLSVALLLDFSGRQDQKLESLIQQKLVQKKAVFNASQFRDLKTLGQDTIPSDIEDLFTIKTYLACFNKAFAKQLAGTVIDEKDLPSGDRIVQRIEQFLKARNIELRPSGGFNHYTVAATFTTTPATKVDSATKSRFAALFKAVNNYLQ
ncbi:AAA family ATPase [Pseudomonas cichorii]|nr:AAA family ATPase [Pseudomonas cichorii]